VLTALIALATIAITQIMIMLAILLVLEILNNVELFEDYRQKKRGLSELVFQCDLIRRYLTTGKQLPEEAAYHCLGDHVSRML
jgi:cell division protein ZapA (FtsZ GTPase activity inhibitor)